MTTAVHHADWLTPCELAAWLRVSKPTVYGMLKRGEVPGVVRLGRVLRISRSAVLAWAKQGCVSQNIEGSRCL